MFSNPQNVGSRKVPHLNRFSSLNAVAACLVVGTVVSVGPIESRLAAQGTTATLGGTVTDATGAVIPNAAVSLKNENSGDRRTSSSNGSGVFSFSGVPTGNYDITITAPGFAGFSQTGIHLDPGDQRSVREIHLGAGGATDTVEVTSGTDAINVDSGEQSSLISSEEIQHLSVEGRDVTELFKILPGFAIATGGAGHVDNRAYDPSQVEVTGALGQYAANGTPLNGVALLSDGADITDPGNFGGAMQTVNYEQVSEVKVQTSSFGADTARGPIVVNAVGKSGGNKYHGSLYTFARTSQLDSTDWISNYTGQQKAPDRQVYPGFTFGGPVMIPGTHFNSAKKLTFFAGAEQYAQKNSYAYGSASSAVLPALVPTAGMRNGDFSATQLAAYLGPAYGTPTTTGCAGLQDQNICQVPGTGPQGQTLVNGNIAPYLDPLSKLIVSRMPLPNTPSNGSYNYITTNLIDNDLWQARGRVDYAISDKNKLFAVYSVQKGNAGVPQSEYYSERGTYLGGIDVPGGGLLSTIDSQIGSLNLTTIFTPTLTNEFYAAAGYLDQNFVPKNLASTQGNPYQGLFNTGSTVTPTLEDYNADGLPLSRLPDGSFGGIYAKKLVRTFGDNVTKVVGKHTIRTGAFYQLDSNHQVIPNVQTNGTINLYYFGPSFNDPVKGKIYDTGYANNNGGNYLANFLEGNVFQYTQANMQPAPNLYFYNLDGYVQDHWRATTRLTLDGGIRLEHFTPWGDAHGQGIPVFSAAAYAAGTNPSEPGFSWHGIDSSVPVQGLATRWAYIEPRVGFAFDAYGTGRTIVRGGYGVYRAHDSFNDVDTGSGTVEGLRTVQLSGPIALSSVSSQAAKATSSLGFTPDSSAYGFLANDSEQPRVRTWNVAVDQRLPGKMVFELAYVGNISDKILNDGSSQNGQNTALDDLNSLPIGSLFQPQPVNSRGFTPGVVYPIFAPAGVTSTTNVTVGGLDQAHIDTYKNYPLYNHVYVAQHNIYANYHGLQAGLTKQQGKSIFAVNYTFSKALGVLGGYANGYAGDPFNARNDYQAESYDHRHIFNASYSYQFGNLVQKHLIGLATNGWEVSGITNFQSGPPLTALVNSNFGLTGTLTVPLGTVAAATPANSSVCSSLTPNATPAPTCQIAVNNTNILGTPDVTLQPLLVGNPASGLAKHHYVNPAAFSLPAIGTNGAYRLGPMTGPGFLDTDLTVAKRFRVNERSSFQLRAAAFNFINHGNNSFTSVQGGASVLNFSGVSTATNANSALNTAASQNANFGYAPLREGRRIMELALRYDF